MTSSYPKIVRGNNVPRELSITEMAFTALIPAQSAKPRASHYGKDSIGQLFEVGDLIGNRGDVFEVEQVFLDDVHGNPIEHPTGLLVHSDSGQVFWSTNEQKANSTIENYLTRVDPDWVPPYVDLIKLPVNRYPQDLLKSVLDDGFERLVFQGLRARVTTVGTSKTARKSLIQSNILAFKNGLTREQIISYSESKNTPLVGKRFLHYKGVLG